MPDRPTVILQYNYWKEREENGRHYRVASDTLEADYVEVYVNSRTYVYVRFDRQEDGTWPEYQMRQLQRMLQQAYDQGRTHKRMQIKQVLDCD